MRWMDKHRWLPVFAVLAALLRASPSALPQPTTESVPDPQQAAQTAAMPPAPEDVGDALMTHQRYQAAIEAYKKASGRSATAMNKMGIAYQMMFDLEDAVRCYRASLKLDPRNPHVYNNLGTAYDGLRMYRNAERMYRKALKLEPGSPLVLKNLGSDQLAQHKYKQGWESYQAALAVDPNIFKEKTTGLRVVNPASVGERGAMNFYMAKGCLRAGLTVRAIDYLRMALNEGFTNPKKIAADSEFASLRGLPAFEQLLSRQSNP